MVHKSTDTFDELHNESEIKRATGKVVISGDFNARTAELRDTIGNIDATFYGPILREYTSDDPQPFCAHTWGHVHSKNVGGPPSKMQGLGEKIHLKSPLASQPVPLKLDSMPPSKGPFSANIHPMIPKLSVPISEDMCIRQMVWGLLQKCRGWGQKSTWNHP